MMGHTMTTVGRYRLVRRLGTGAFATVWLGHDDEFDVPVAIKVLAENWAEQADVRERFVAEARLLRRIPDDRVVHVHDIGTMPDGRPYFVMDHADAGTLADLVKQRLDPPDALRLGAELARAVQVLHEHGYLHRDLKPANLLLTRRVDGGIHLVIADLGLAKALIEASGVTLAGGTPSYMAPEQAHGQSGLDERADVYAVAAVTYALVTGRPPYEIRDGVAGVALRDPDLTPPPVAPTTGLPAEVDTVFANALAYAPEKRPTASTLAENLTRLADGRVSPVAAPVAVTYAPTEPESGPGARSGLTPTGLAALAVLVAAVVAALTWFLL